MEAETAIDRLEDIYVGLEREYDDSDTLRTILNGIQFVRAALEDFEPETGPSEDDLAWSADHRQRVRDAA